MSEGSVTMEPLWDTPTEPRTKGGRHLIASFPANCADCARPEFIRHVAQSILAIEDEAAALAAPTGLDDLVLVRRNSGGVFPDGTTNTPPIDFNEEPVLAPPSGEPTIADETRALLYGDPRPRPTGEPGPMSEWLRDHYTEGMSDDPQHVARLAAPSGEQEGEG